MPSSPVHYGECMKYSSPAPVTASVTALVMVAMKVSGWSLTGRDRDWVGSQLRCTKSHADTVDRCRPSGSLGSLNFMRIQGPVEGKGCLGCACWHGHWVPGERPRSVPHSQPGTWISANSGACSKQQPPRGGLPGRATPPLGPEVLTLILPVSQVRAES